MYFFSTIRAAVYCCHFHFVPLSNISNAYLIQIALPRTSLLCFFFSLLSRKYWLNHAFSGVPLMFTQWHRSSRNFSENSHSHTHKACSSRSSKKSERNYNKSLNTSRITSIQYNLSKRTAYFARYQPANFPNEFQNTFLDG